MELVKFPNKGEHAAFFKELRKEVNTYFKENNISKYANLSMKLKTLLMVSLYLIPYGLMLGGVVSSNWGIIGVYVVMALGMSGVGLSVMHDANHGAYSKKKWVNTVLGNMINFAGGSAVNWRLQHNVLHHTFTNITGLDQDINIGKLMRFSPREKRLKAHNYQHLYAWVLYSLMTIYWVIGKDFKDLMLYKREGILQMEKESFSGTMARILVTKVIYIFFALVLPILLVGVPAWVIVVGFIIKHLLSGLILSMIFQPAHVIEETSFPVPDENMTMGSVMAVHQLNTTANFATRSKVFTWLVGGLNHQIEHHLFPTICHVHYPEIAKIVKRAATKYDLPYYEQPTFFAALADHARMLKKLGRQDFIAS